MVCLPSPRASAADASLRAMLHDPAVWPSPAVFSPERFLTPAGALDPSVPELTAAFGFGRRACAGSAMAHDALWICAAAVLWAFDIKRTVDAAGRPIEVSPDKYVVGVVW